MSSIKEVCIRDSDNSFLRISVGCRFEEITVETIERKENGVELTQRNTFHTTRYRIPEAVIVWIKYLERR